MEDSSDFALGRYGARAWGRIGGGRARQILEASLRQETSEFPKREIEAALASAA